MREYMILDTSKFPIVIGTYQDFVPTAEEFQKWQTDMDSFMESHERYVTVLDFSRVRNLPVEYRISAGKWAAKNDKLFVQKKLTAIFCTPSLSTSIMMKALLIASRPRSPHFMVSNLDKAMALAAKKVKEMYSTE